MYNTLALVSLSILIVDYILIQFIRNYKYATLRKFRCKKCFKLNTYRSDKCTRCGNKFKTWKGYKTITLGRKQCKASDSTIRMSSIKSFARFDLFVCRLVWLLFSIIFGISFAHIVDILQILKSF